MARIGLRMMPPFPWSPLKFSTAGFPHCGFSAGISGGALPAARYLPQRSVCHRPSCTSPIAFTPPFCAGERAALVHLRSSGFRDSTPGALAPVRVIYSVPHHHHLISPMRPTRRHIWISPSRLIRDAIAVRHTSTPRRPASGSVLSLAILCRHVALRDPGKPVGCLYPVPSPTALALDLLGRSRHFLHPPPSDSREGVHFRA
jgi:hypothetical protein